MIKDHEVLDTEVQRKLLEEAQSGDESASEKLVLHNLRLIVKIAREFPCPEFLELDDLVSEGISALQIAIKDHDPERSPNFIGFFSTAIRWRIQNIIKRYPDPTISLNIPLDSEEEDSEELQDRIEDPSDRKKHNQWVASEDLKALFKYLTEKEQIVLILSHGIFGFDRYSTTEIATIWNCSHATIQSWQKKALEKMQEIAMEKPREIVREHIYPLVGQDTVREIVNNLQLRSTKEKWETKTQIKVRKKMHSSFDPTIVQHDFTFGQNRTPHEFIAMYGRSIRTDYKLGCHVSGLAEKYQCSRTLILKILEGE